jgi:hypothetical protein
MGMKIELDEPKAIHHNKYIMRRMRGLPPARNVDTLPIAADKPARRMMSIASLVIVIIGAVLLGLSITLITQAQPHGVSGAARKRFSALIRAKRLMRSSMVSAWRMQCCLRLCLSVCKWM